MEMDLSVADDYILGLIEKLTSKCITLSDLKACYSIISDTKFDFNTAKIRIHNQTLNLSKIVATALKNSTSLALFVGTCGEQVELLSKQLMREGHMLESLIVDLVASELAEGVADFVHKKIENDVADLGFYITNRYSPGYCNWPVSDQQKLFTLLGENTCGVILTASSLMVPIKSVSGIIGIGSEVKFRGYACAKCDDAHCIYRNRR
jgi:hypothetical protein